MSEPSGTDARLDHIEALTEQLEAARADAKEAEAYAEQLEKELDRVAAINANHCRTVNTYVVDNARLADRAEESEAKLAKAVEALRKLHHAVCGETGFAACVRLDSGLAYPWPALDEADKITRAVLAEIESSEAVTLEGEKG